MITSGPTLGRADVDAKGLWNGGHWVLELRRKLVTGEATDVQFDDLNRKYAFGVVMFDNAQIEHPLQLGGNQACVQALIPCGQLTALVGSPTRAVLFSRS